MADGVAETTETVILTLAPGTAYAIGAPATASVAIADADFDPTATTLVALSATDPNAAETGPDPGTLTLYRTGNKNLPLTVNLHLAGTAKNGIDYNQVTTATFASGVAKTTLNISPIDDDIAEGPETVIVSVDPSSGVLTGPYQPTVTIQDNEPWPGPMGLYTLPPCRLADTRWPASPVGAPALAAGEIRIVPVSGHCGVPPEAIAVSVNVTVVNPTAVGSLTLFEPGAPRPITTTLSFQAGQNRANNALLPLLGRPSALALYLGLATGTADVVIDVNGYFE